MRVVDFLDKGASLGPDQPCLTTDGESLSYGQVQQISRNEAGEKRELLALFDAQVVLFQESFAPLVAKICADLPTVHTWVCLEADVSSVVPQSIT